MNSDEFEGVLLGGHQENAIEVPFNPAARWGIPAGKLWNGRNGHFVGVMTGGITFESVIVARMKKYFLLIADDICTSAKIKVGDKISVCVGPLAAPTELRR